MIITNYSINLVCTKQTFQTFLPAIGYVSVLAVIIQKAGQFVPELIERRREKRRLENDFHFKMSREIEERSVLMCNLSALILEKGIQQGRQDDIWEGIQQEKENSLFRIAKISCLIHSLN